MHQIDLLIFDLDGTLVDTRQDLTNSVNYARNELGFPALELETVIKYVGNGVRKLMERSLPEKQWDKIEEAIALFQNHYQDHALDFTTLYPGVKETLNHFRHKKMAVISNKPENFSRSILKGLRVESYFDLVLGGDSLPFMKPSPEPVYKVLHDFAVKPERTVMVGDGVTDIEAGKQAKVLTCAVSYGFRKKELLLTAKPDYLVDSIVELRKLFV
ncbi:MAG: HAD family hydrolase [bacterium]